MIVRPVPPFRLDLTVWALRRRARNAIDQWDGSTYRRVIVVERRPTELAVYQDRPAATPRLIVTATPALRTDAERRRVRSLLNGMLGLRVDLREWYRIAERDRRLRTLANRFRGVKPPRFPTVFEALVNAFACQQLSLVAGLELLNRLAAVCDVRRGADGNARYAFPAPRDVARMTLAHGIDRGAFDFDGLARDDDDQVCARLRQLRGVGRWTAEYVLLRGLGRLNVFPGDDVGAQKSLARWLGRSAEFDYAGVSRAVEKWQPYAGMVYFHLLLDGLSQAGEVIE